MASLLSISSSSSAFFFAVSCCSLLLLASAHNLLTYSSLDLHSEARLLSLFDAWNARHGKLYGPEPQQKAEKHRRFHIFKKNLMYIDEHNRLGGGAGSGSPSFRLGLTRFADLTNEEFVASRRLGLKLSLPRSRPGASWLGSAASPNEDLPDSIDWRELGAVTAPKDQGMCGSCWAFSATGAIEGANAIATGTLISVSEQELVTCDVGGMSSGCNGGLMDDAFEWVVNNGGIATEEAYPYESGSGESGVCNTQLQGEDKTITIDGYIDVEAYSETALMAAVAKQPVSVAIEASAWDFQLYSEGIYNGSCSNNPFAINHGVLVVGYGTEDGVNYWIVKNSWSDSWGDQGYIRMIRNGSPFGICAIHSMSSYPVKNASTILASDA